MDNFKEEIVFARGGKAKRIIMQTLVYLLIGVFGLAGFILGLMPVMNMQLDLFSLLSLAVGAGAVFMLWRYKDTLDIEYEYTFTNGEMDFAKVLARKRRRHLLTLRVKDAEAGGLMSGDLYKRYATMRDIKVLDFTLNDSRDNRFLYFIRDGGKHMLLFEPSEVLWKMILKANSRIQPDAGLS